MVGEAQADPCWLAAARRGCEAWGGCSVWSGTWAGVWLCDAGCGPWSVGCLLRDDASASPASYSKNNLRDHGNRSSFVCGNGHARGGGKGGIGRAGTNFLGICFGGSVLVSPASIPSSSLFLLAGRHTQSPLTCFYDPRILAFQRVDYAHKPRHTPPSPQEQARQGVASIGSSHLTTTRFTFLLASSPAALLLALPPPGFD